MKILKEAVVYDKQYRKIADLTDKFLNTEIGGTGMRDIAFLINDFYQGVVGYTGTVDFIDENIEALRDFKAAVDKFVPTVTKELIVYKDIKKKEQ